MSKTIYIQWVVFFAVFLMQGCSGVQFYAHNIRGHFSVLYQKKPIENILADAQVNQELKRRLRLSQQILSFAETKLQLPSGGSYRHYVALDRPYVRWNVITAPELSVEAKPRCFLIIGCFIYLGYFNKQDAEEYANKMRRKGLDAHVSGAIAYSTLGWFDDPLLSSMMAWSDFQMAEFIFHELTHQKLFITNDHPFNEAFATMVADYGVEQWRRQYHKPIQWRKFQEHKRKYRAFIDLALTTRRELDELYQSNTSNAEKRLGKTAIFKNYRQKYQEKLRNKQIMRHDKWFKELNNAKFASLAAYQRLVPAFYAILAQQRGRLSPFYRAVKDLERLSKQARSRKLEQLLDAQADKIIKP